ncbi:MAG: GGDEF domain-containing protein [Ruminococcus sp.]|nr:GGDEF domain-containing protein [Ruminococcus sp.]
MEKRKAIAVVAADVSTDYMNRICVGISEQCRHLGYDLYNLFMSFNLDGGSTIQFGEENIFSLIKKDSVSGVIILMQSVANKEIINKIGDSVISQGIPIISIDSKLDFCDCIIAEDEKLMEMMTDHFIEHHGCKKMICLTGFEGLPVSESRIVGYKNSLIKHGIEYDENLVIYGDFWKAAAEKLAKEFISGERPMPDAVICANDSMAISLCNTLIDGGVNVPEDILVSGYDGSRDAMENIPSITTICPENGSLGARAVLRLHKMITGEDGEAVDMPRGGLVLAGSCGCSDGFNYVIKQREGYKVITDQYESYYNNSGMQEALSTVENLDNLINQLSNYMYLLRDMDSYTMCLNKEWDSFENSDESEYLRNGYPEKMETRMIYKVTEPEFDSVPHEYCSCDVIPDSVRKYYEEPTTYYILPLHFMDRCFGYSLFVFNDLRFMVSQLFSLWNRNINIALEFLRVRTKLTMINQRITLSSIRDTLTGIYNRQGFKRYSESIFQKALTEKKKLFILMADLDMLKHINDNFGHVEGDNAISVCANGLNTCCENNEICARIGGDEYSVIGAYDYTDDIINGYIKYINNYFDRYNSSSGKKYSVGASLGYYCGYVEDGRDFQYYMDIADKRMYENKFERKKFRKE